MRLLDCAVGLPDLGEGSLSTAEAAARANENPSPRRQSKQPSQHCLCTRSPAAAAAAQESAAERARARGRLRAYLADLLDDVVLGGRRGPLVAHGAWRREKEEREREREAGPVSRVVRSSAMDWSARAVTLLSAHLQTTRQAQHRANVAGGDWTGPTGLRLMCEPASSPNRLFSPLFCVGHLKKPITQGTHATWTVLVPRRSWRRR